MMAEDYASLAADWHLEWMPPKTLEAGLEARADIAARLAGRLGFGRVDQDAPFRRRPPWRETRPGGGGGSWLPPTSWHRSSVGVWQALRP